MFYYKDNVSLVRARIEEVLLILFFIFVASSIRASYMSAEIPAKSFINIEEYKNLDELKNKKDANMYNVVISRDEYISLKHKSAMEGYKFDTEKVIPSKYDSEGVRKIAKKEMLEIPRILIGNKSAAYGVRKMFLKLFMIE